MPATYEPIATTVLSSTTTGVSFTSINQTYTDLVVIAQLKYNASANAYGGTFTVNATGGTSYSETILYGYGASPSSQRTTNDAAFRPTEYAGNGIPPFAFMRLDFMNYSSTTVKKTVLRQMSFDKNSSGSIDRSVGLFNSTSAITSIQFDPYSVGFSAGCTFTLYGIKAA
jgi:hypothetical protein